MEFRTKLAFETYTKFSIDAILLSISKTGRQPRDILEDVLNLQNSLCKVLSSSWVFQMFRATITHEVVQCLDV